MLSFSQPPHAIPPRLKPSRPQRMPGRPRRVQLCLEAGAFSLGALLLVPRRLQIGHGGLPSISRLGVLGFQVLQTCSQTLALLAEPLHRVLAGPGILLERCGIIAGQARLLRLQLCAPGPKSRRLRFQPTHLFLSGSGVHRRASLFQRLSILQLGGSLTELPLLLANCLQLRRDLVLNGRHVRGGHCALGLRITLLGADLRFQVGNLVSRRLHSFVGQFHGSVYILHGLVVCLQSLLASRKVAFLAQVACLHFPHAIQLHTQLSVLCRLRVRTAQIHLQDVANGSQRILAPGLRRPQ
mmetsp:Transcript_93653/g.303178  ORF Transcript_93653/g.303178 Transcript_93653/m.303178 type:complete len:297 (-) Transcript_93653:2091-2981(-)